MAGREDGCAVGVNYEGEWKNERSADACDAVLRGLGEMGRLGLHVKRRSAAEGTKRAARDSRRAVVGRDGDHPKPIRRKPGEVRRIRVAQGHLKGAARASEMEGTRGGADDLADEEARGADNQRGLEKA